MAKRKIQDIHKLFIIKQVAAFITSSTTIAEQLADADMADRFGFDPVKVSQQRVAILINKIDPESLKSERESYLSDFESNPLAHKRVRCDELTKIYHDLNNQSIMDTEKRTSLQLRVLNQIKEEIGEDVSKLADAIAGSGGNNIVNIVNDNSELARILANAQIGLKAVTTTDRGILPPL